MVRGWPVVFVLFAGVGHGATTLGAEEGNRLAARLFPSDYRPSPLRAPVDFKTVAYQWRGRTLSGLLATPRNPKGIVLYCHGTIADDRMVPSRAPLDPKGEALLAALAFAGRGYAVAMPDYPGQGRDARSIHPYPLARVNGDAAAVMILSLPQTLRRRVIVTGYSEGGAVALAASLALEDKGLTPAATAPLSGPYDLAGVQTKGLLEDERNLKWRFARVFLLAYAGRAAGRPLSQMFVPGFASFVPGEFSKVQTDATRARRLGIRATRLGAIRSVRAVLRPSFLDALRNGDRRDPTVAAFRANTLLDRMPQGRTLLVANRGDRVVLEGNADAAVDAARRRGEGTDRVRLVKLSRFDHLTGLAPQLTLAGRFFSGERVP